MAAIFAELREAAEWNINVSVSTTQCIGAPGYSCVGNLQFKM
jgi:hypothetical protein